jgi:hypothetical protein
MDEDAQGEMSDTIEDAETDSGEPIIGEEQECDYISRKNSCYNFAGRMTANILLNTICFPCCRIDKINYLGQNKRKSSIKQTLFTSINSPSTLTKSFRLSLVSNQALCSTILNYIYSMKNAGNLHHLSTNYYICSDLKSIPLVPNTFFKPSGASSTVMQ